MLPLENLHVRVGGHAVIRGIDLHVMPGEAFILFGPDGSGKTTLLMAIMGFSGHEATTGNCP